MPEADTQAIGTLAILLHTWVILYVLVDISADHLQNFILQYQRSDTYVKNSRNKLLHGRPRNKFMSAQLKTISVSIGSGVTKF